jgi:hypothetical protein
VIDIMNCSFAYETLTFDLSMSLLFLSLLVMFLSVRSLTEDKYVMQVRYVDLVLSS